MNDCILRAISNTKTMIRHAEICLKYSNVPARLVMHTERKKGLLIGKKVFITNSME